MTKLVVVVKRLKHLLLVQSQLQKEVEQDDGLGHFDDGVHVVNRLLRLPGVAEVVACSGGSLRPLSRVWEKLLRDARRQSGCECIQAHSKRRAVGDDVLDPLNPLDWDS